MENLKFKVEMSSPSTETATILDVPSSVEAWSLRKKDFHPKLLRFIQRIKLVGDKVSPEILYRKGYSEICLYLSHWLKEHEGKVNLARYHSIWPLWEEARQWNPFPNDYDGTTPPPWQHPDIYLPLSDDYIMAPIPSKVPFRDYKIHSLLLLTDASPESLRNYHPDVQTYTRIYLGITILYSCRTKDNLCPIAELAVSRNIHGERVISVRGKAFTPIPDTLRSLFYKFITTHLSDAPIRWTKTLAYNLKPSQELLELLPNNPQVLPFIPWDAYYQYLQTTALPPREVGENPSQGP